MPDLSLRQQVEQVLRQYLHSEKISLSGIPTIAQQFIPSELLDSICALLTPTTQPDREALVELLRVCGIHESENKPLIDRLMAWATPVLLRREDLDASAEAWRVAMKEAIWAWVCGRKEQPAWCTHWKWNGTDWQGTAHEDTPHLRECEEHLAHDNGWNPLRWKVCPICGTERPEIT